MAESEQKEAAPVVNELHVSDATIDRIKSKSAQEKSRENFKDRIETATVGIIILYTLFAGFQWYELNTQNINQSAANLSSGAIADRSLMEIQKTANDTHELALKTKALVEETKRSANATNSIASAAKTSADAASSQLELSERPWISVDISRYSPLVFDKDGGHLSVILTMKNSGRSPAIRVRPFIVWFPIFLTEPDPAAKLMEVCKSVESKASTPITPEAIANGQHFFSQAVFPNVPDQQQEWDLAMSPADIEESASGIGGRMGFPGGYHPAIRSLQSDIAVCVGYRAPFGSTQYETGIVEQLITDRRIPYIRPDAGNTIPMDDLNLRINYPFGIYAK